MGGSDVFFQKTLIERHQQISDGICCQIFMSDQRIQAEIPQGPSRLEHRIQAPRPQQYIIRL